MSYARDTSVPVERSRAQLQVLVEKAGATEILTGVVGNAIQLITGGMEAVRGLLGPGSEADAG